MTRDEDVEKLARAMCVVDGVHPDTIVSKYTPAITNTGRFFEVPQPPYARPMWHMMVEHARIAFDHFKDRLKDEPEEQSGEDTEMTTEQAQEYARQEDIYEVDAAKDNRLIDGWKDRMALR